MELKKEAIRLHVEEKWTYRQITDHLHIQDADRVKKWMQPYRKLGEFGLLDHQSQVRRKRRCAYSADAAGLVAENLFKQNFKANKPNEKWITDITQYRIGERWLYLSAIKDLFNNEIVTYEIGEHQGKELAQRTFKKVFHKRKDVTGVVIHSDRGAPYTSHLYSDMLPKVGVQISMSRGGNYYDNASIELLLASQNGEALSVFYEKFG